MKWHHVEHHTILKTLDSSESGLTDDEVSNRLKQYGSNELTPPKRRTAFQRFISQLNNVLIYILIAACVVTLLLGKWVDASVILGVIMVNTALGFIQEGRAERAIQSLNKMLSSQATVIRNHHRFQVPVATIVPGDHVVLEAGDRVPADMRLYQTKALKLDEAVLTGESEATEKTTAPLPESVALPERTNMVYSGTFVTSGYGRGIVVATGDRTEIGQIGAFLAEIPSLSTPLLRKMTTFSHWLALSILVAAAFIVLFGYGIRDYALSEIFMATVGITVAAIPEGLPIILTIALAIGVERMARQHAIIRRLPAVETLGSTTVICTDKTGTLTRNEMTAQTIGLAKHRVSVTGVGYAPQGDFYVNKQTIDPQQDPDIWALGEACVLCNEASLIRDDNGVYVLHGDPTEGALLTLGLKMGCEPSELIKAMPRIDLIPFESQHKFMATLHHDHQGHYYSFLKGAPEVILDRCDKVLLDGQQQTINLPFWHQQVHEIASLGQRALAIAIKKWPSEKRALTFDDVEDGLTLLGIVGMYDPPREEVVPAIQECYQAGVQIKMITGDHAKTAAAIAEQISLIQWQTPITGTELDEIDDANLYDRIKASDVFARTSPRHKLRLVETLQDHDEVVAMTGDGVNDAPALKRADIGIAMGVKGTEVAKESAEMVLTDDNFASIVAAIKQGRTVYDNLKKAITFLLPINGGESLSLLGAIFLGLTLPITPLQILWVNMVSSVSLAMALAFEPPEPNVMQRRPIPVRDPLLSYVLIWRIVLVSCLFVGGVFIAFFLGQAFDLSIETARTLAVNTLVLLEVAYLFSSRYKHGPSLTLTGIRGTPAVLIAVGAVAGLQLAFTYLPVMQRLFQTEFLSFMQCLFIGLLGVIVFTILEVDKWIYNRFLKQDAP